MISANSERKRKPTIFVCKLNKFPFTFAVIYYCRNFTVEHAWTICLRCSRWQFALKNGGLRWRPIAGERISVQRSRWQLNIHKASVIGAEHLFDGWTFDALFRNRLGRRIDRVHMNFIAFVADRHQEDSSKPSRSPHWESFTKTRTKMFAVR